MGRKSNDMYLEGTNTKALVVLVIIFAIIAAGIGVLIISNLVSPSTDPHNIEVVNFTRPTETPTSFENSTIISTNATGSALKIHFIDVGQADCALIEHNGQYAFIDVGKSSKGNYYSTIRLHEPNKVAWILASHQDSDHIGNIGYVMSGCTVNTFYDNGVTSNTLTYKELMDKINNLKITYDILHEGETIDTWNDVKIEAVAVCSSGGQDMNDDGIVLRLEYDGVVVGFTADVSDAVDADIGRKLGDVDILKVAHHGAKSSTSEEFLRYAKPELSIISVGDNTYGHPSAETITRLSKYGVVYRTDELGCIEVVIQNGDYKVVRCEYV